MGGSGGIEGDAENGTVEEGAVVASARFGGEVMVGRVVVGVGRIPGIGGVVCMGVGSRSGGVGARVIGGWWMRGSDIGHAMGVRGGGSGAGGAGGRRGEFVFAGSSMVVLRGVRGVRGMRRSRVHATSIGIFCVANERLEEALVSVTVTMGRERGAGDALGTLFGRETRG